MVEEAILAAHSRPVGCVGDASIPDVHYAKLVFKWLTRGSEIPTEDLQPQKESADVSYEFIYGPYVGLDHRWREATAVVLRAQIEYTQMLSSEKSEGSSASCKWLQLWRAQEAQRQCLRQLEQLTIPRGR